eukprot:5792172-Amphidinium_carterae.1
MVADVVQLHLSLLVAKVSIESLMVSHRPFLLLVSSDSSPKIAQLTSALMKVGGTAKLLCTIVSGLIPRMVICALFTAVGSCFSGMWVRWCNACHTSSVDEDGP